ncbi:MAG TPA: transcriptional repressor, partial [Aggregatilineales bacterium]|nr:transcriptional repressor [Aggregatilineales bacterium]
ATVYNTLSLLVELDLIHEIASPTEGSTRYDPQVAPHLNLICTNCNRIIDVDDVDLTYLEELTARYGFEVADVNVVLHGLCAECRHNLN